MSDIDLRNIKRQLKEAPKRNEEKVDLKPQSQPENTKPIIKKEENMANINAGSKKDKEDLQRTEEEVESKQESQSKLGDIKASINEKVSTVSAKSESVESKKPNSINMEGDMKEFFSNAKECISNYMYPTKEKNQYGKWQIEGIKNDLIKQEVHKAGEFLQSLGSIHKFLYAIMTPNYAAHDFNSVWIDFNNEPKALEGRPFYLANYNGFDGGVEEYKKSVNKLMLDKESGINDATILGFNNTFERGDQGKEDLNAYCVKNAKSPGDALSICSKEFIEYSKKLLDAYNQSKDEKFKDSYVEIIQIAKDKTIMHEKVHAAGDFYSVFFNIHELALRNNSPHASPSNFSKLFKEYMKNPKIIEDYVEINAEAFKKLIIEKCGLQGSGISSFTKKAFLEIIGTPHGADDVIKYCDLHTTSPSDNNAYCNSEAMEYAKSLVGEITSYDSSN